MDTLDNIISKYGFKSLKEFNELVNKVDLSDPDKLKAFEDWKLNDGTKESLLKIISENEN